MCVLANLEYLSILFCAVLWAAAPGLVAVLPMWDSGLLLLLLLLLYSRVAFSALTLLDGRQKRHPACKN